MEYAAKTQRIFEPSSLPNLPDPDSREEVPPEDTPVKNRQQPGYEPVGIRAGSWLFSPALDSQGYQALSGVTLAMSNLLTGEFAAGYVQQKFVDPTIGTIEGPTYRARLTWRPTRLLDVHFNAEQLVTETADTSSVGVLANAVQLGADYELRRDVIVSVAASYETDKFFGQLRKDRVATTDASIKYLLNRYGAISLYHRISTATAILPPPATTNIR